MTIDIDRLTEAELIDLNVDSHSWRARGITAYLENGGLLEHAQAMAGHVRAHDEALRPPWRAGLSRRG